jgi:hypothetical protein
MALQSSARIKGDDFQFLYTWLRVLDLLKKNSNVAKVRIEDPDATHVDDVTVFFKDDTAPHYYQVKYHVDLKNLYTLKLLLEKGKKGKSLMEKFYTTYKEYLDANPGIAARLHLVSNWGIDPEDKVLSTAENEHRRLGTDLRSASANSDIGKALQAIKDDLKIGDAELHEFLDTLCFYTGKDCTDEFKIRVQERMDALNLKSDEADLVIAVNIVRDWVKEKHVEVDLKILDEVLKKWNLYAPPAGLSSATVYLVTVKKHQFEISPDYIIDLRKYYADHGEVKGHELLPEYDYNSTLLSKIQGVQRKVNDETRATLIRARGFSRLSPWFAFGYTFSGVSGYTIEVKQGDVLWRTDDNPNADFNLISANGKGEDFDSTTGTVAVGLSVTGEVEADVRDHITRIGGVDALLLLRPDRELGQGCLRSGGDAVALTQQFKKLTREFAKEKRAQKLLLYYFGPLSGACFMGHQLNAICKQVQIMENIVGEGYVNSFLLS